MDFNIGYYTEHDLVNAGFKSLGHNVLIAKNTNIVGVENITIGNHVRIDPFSSLIVLPPGKLELQSYNHIGCYCLLSAGAGIILEPFAAMSHGVKLFSKSDNYNGDYLIGPTIPDEYVDIKSGTIVLKNYVVLGANAVVLPNLTIAEGCIIGAMSFVTTSLSDSWWIYAGIPVKKIKPRSNGLIKFANKLLPIEETI